MFSGGLHSYRHIYKLLNCLQTTETGKGDKLLHLCPKIEHRQNKTLNKSYMNTIIITALISYVIGMYVGKNYKRFTTE